MSNYPSKSTSNSSQASSSYKHIDIDSSPIDYTSPYSSYNKSKTNISFDQSTYTPVSLSKASRYNYSDNNNFNNDDNNFNNNNNNNNNRSNKFNNKSNSFFNSGTNISPSQTPITTIPTTTSIITAFRELQTKQKQIEHERIHAYKERDELRQMITEKRRNQALYRSKNEIESTETFLHLRSNNEKLKYEITDLDRNILNHDNKIISLEKQLSSQHALCFEYQEDIKNNNTLIYSIEYKNKLLHDNLNKINSRLLKLNHDTIESPKKYLTKNELIQEEINKLQDEINIIKLKNNHIQNKTKNLENYSDLIIKINNDLCDTLMEREKVIAEIIKLTIEQSLSIPPHYLWPKNMNYSEILDIVQKAAALNTNIALQTSALKATKAATQAIVRALTPPPTPSSREKKQYSTPTSPYRNNSPYRTSSPQRMHSNSDTTLASAQQTLDNTITTLESVSNINNQLLNYSLNQNLEHSLDSGVDHGRELYKSLTSPIHSSSGSGSHHQNHNTRSIKASRKAVARQGAITLATRFAAAATGKNK